MKKYTIRLIALLLTFLLGYTSASLLRSPDYAVVIQKDTAHKTLQLSFGTCRNKLVQRLQASVNSNPQDPQARLFLAESLLDIGCYKEAAAEYEQAIALGFSDAETYDFLANTYDHLGRYEDGLMTARKGIELQPDASLYAELGWVYNALDKPLLATEALKKSIQLEPEEAFAYAELAESYLKLGRKRDAALWAGKAVSLSESDYDDAALNNAGLVFLKLGMYREAKHALQASITLNHDQSSGYYLMSKLNLLEGENNQAALNYRRTLRQTPLEPSDYLRRCWVYLLLEDDENAAAEAMRYLSRTDWKGHDAPLAAVLAYLSLKRDGQDAQAQQVILEASNNCDTSVWFYNILRYYLRQISARELCTQASGIEELTEAKAFIGFDLLAEGKLDEAISYLTWVRQHGDRSSSVYALTHIELQKH